MIGRAGLWWAGVALLAVALWALAVTDRLQIESNMLALLPEAQRNPIKAAAMARVAQMGQRQLVILVGAESPELNDRAASAAAAALAQSEAFVSVLQSTADVLSGSEWAAVRQLHFAHRFHLLAPADRAALARLTTPPQSDDKAARRHFMVRAKTRLYGIGMGGGAFAFIEDPLGLAGAYRSARMAGLALPGLQLARDGHFYVSGKNGQRFAVIFATSRRPPYTLSAQAAQLAALDAARAAAHAVAPEATILVSGVLPHAAAATQQARHEVSVIGLGSLAGILVLMLWVFHSIRPFLLSVTVMAGGCLLALVAAGLVFGGIHVITLVFGTSIAGVAIDYCLHFFAQRFDTPAPHRAIRCILPAIALGLIANVLAYSSMGVPAFPGLRQMAVIAVFGLIGAWLGVVLLLPAWAGPPARPGTALTLARRWLEHGPARVARAHRNRLLWGMVAALVVLAPITAVYLDPVDDIGVLYDAPAELQQVQRRVSNLLGTHSLGRTLAVHADSRSALLQAESRLVEALGGPTPVADITAITESFPTIPEQRRGYRRLAHTLYAPNGPVATLLRKAGYSEQRIQAHLQAFAQQQGQVLAFETWLHSPASKGLRRLWLGRVEQQWVSLVRVHQVHDRQTFNEIISQQPHVIAIDRTAQLSRLLAQYRELAAWLLGGAYVVALLLLSWILGPRGALTVLLPPMVASVTVALVFALMNWSFSLFNLLAMILLLGLGADYGIFLRMATRHNASAMLAVGASVVTNLLAFGLLSLSATPALHSFGLTLAMGLVLTFMLTSLVAGREPARAQTSRA